MISSIGFHKRQDVNFSGSDVPSEDGAFENVEDRLGLIRRHVVTGLEYPGERYPIVLPHETTLIAGVCANGCVPCAAEGGGFGILHGKGDVLNGHPCVEQVSMAGKLIETS